ncbi:MAG: flagellar export protein FliJ [Gemmatimonadetes bacterium]|nr:flagellar export protein FliJ [Gemmatimonadota bacterium]
MFKFPLQRLLDLRAKREQELARQLAAAQGEALRVTEVRDALRDLQAESAVRLAALSHTSASVGELVSLGYTVTQMGERVETASDAVTAAEAVVTKQGAVLTDAVRDRRVLDRLRDRREDEHRAVEQQKERDAMDAVALGRFTRRTPNDNPTGGPQ